MPNCTLADILKNISEKEVKNLTDDHNFGKIDEKIVDDVIAQADNEISVYTQQTATENPVLKDCAVVIVIYNLYLRRGDVPETREKAYEKKVNILKEIRKGKASLPSTAAAHSGGSFGVVETSPFESPAPAIAGLET